MHALCVHALQYMTGIGGVIAAAALATACHTAHVLRHATQYSVTLKRLILYCKAAHSGIYVLSAAAVLL
eukprot:6272-Heterococcus_DN1.PRE.6